MPNGAAKKTEIDGQRSGTALPLPLWRLGSGPYRCPSIQCSEKSPPRTFELATPNLALGSGVSRAMASPRRDRAALCFCCNTFLCSALLTKFSVDYLSTNTTREAHALAPWSGSIQAGAPE